MEGEGATTSVPKAMVVGIGLWQTWIRESAGFLGALISTLYWGKIKANDLDCSKDQTTPSEIICTAVLCGAKGDYCM